MGADGSITIWRRDDVLREWPDADKLFLDCPHGYRNQLGDVEVYHAYIGDNTFSRWVDVEDWWCQMTTEQKERVTKFIKWLEANIYTEWEVWT